MTQKHPIHYLVKAQRNNIVVHVQEAASQQEAEELKARFERVPHTEAEIVEVHEPGETDLTTKTREIVEEIASQAHE